MKKVATKIVLDKDILIIGDNKKTQDCHQTVNCDSKCENQVSLKSVINELLDKLVDKIQDFVFKLYE
jgi:hypothetical protein